MRPKLQDIARAGLQSASIMFLADCLTQVGIEGKGFNQNLGGKDDDAEISSVGSAAADALDPRRSLRWATAGFALHGPYFFLGFRAVDGAFGAATTLSTVLKKTAAAQLALFPPYLVVFFACMGWMEGSSDIAQKVKQRVPEAFLGGCVFWPVANGINFAMVPASFRIPYLASCAGVWNCYLSFANSRGNDTANKTNK